ncbi:MAG: beta-phosphoglucomutase family hydrolase [Chlorobiaceae bacterium]|nr:beta-phosphoglucomutase family hydrolase [Chlorobiaceae bacterium]
MSMNFKGVIFDLDGVITGTARIHSLAWEAMFNSFLKNYAEINNEPFVPFNPAYDYLKYVDGKPRMEGVKSFLASRDIEIPYGELDDIPEQETVCGLGNRKNSLFTEILIKEGPEVFQSSVDFIKALKARGIRIGIASSSRNCLLILQLSKLEELFETRVDGEVSIELKLKGKPNPDIFITAAANLGLEPHECVVVEDAISGVQAGARGNFGLVLGIAREIEGHKLREQGADIVVRDLAEITLDDICEWFDKGLEKDGWNLRYESWAPKEERLRESLLTTGNGYMGVRGAFEGGMASQYHYPGTYLAGVFNKLPSEVHGQTVWNNDMVNAPNWLPIEFRIGNGELINPLEQKILSYRQNLDMQHAVMERDMVILDTLGNITRIRSRRFCSMDNPHLAAIKYIIEPVNYTAVIELRSTIDGRVQNRGVIRYNSLSTDHLEHAGHGRSHEERGIYLHVRTSHSKTDIVTHVRTTVRCGYHGEAVTEGTITSSPRWISEHFLQTVSPERGCSVEKVVSIHTSRDTAHPDPVAAGRESLAGAGSFDELLQRHSSAWEAIWKKADMKIEGDRFTQKVLRLHIYHLVSTVSPHNTSIDASIAARGLSGEGYRGHYFWDEIYIMPFFIQHLPEVARALMMYRYRRLDAAREYARENGYRGAMFPWQTADDGREETPTIHYNPKSGAWDPDLSCRQRHVSIAVFYNTWRYVHDSGDTEFLNNYGAEMMFEIARFWANIATCSPETGRYHIEGVMGPDEFHEEFPGSGKHGLRDNTYTNIMTTWLLEKALEVSQQLDPEIMDRLMERIGISHDEFMQWRDISGKMNVLIDQSGLLEQFDGYMKLKELDWEHYRLKYGNIHRMDRILKAENDSPDHYKVAKQADVLMTFYTLSPAEVCSILEKLGYPVSDPLRFVRDNYAYYEPRTSHGSTLSKVVHSIISSYLQGGQETAWSWFIEALRSDIHDTQGGTTPEGLHCGVMAGTLDTVTRYFSGISFHNGLLTINPNFPLHWKKIETNLCFRKNWYHIVLTPSSASVTLTESVTGEAQSIIGGHAITLRNGEETTVPLN